MQAMKQTVIPSHPEYVAKLMKSATVASVGVATVLIIAKLAAWMLSDSVSMLASLADSLMDSLASVLNLLAVRYSLQPADNDHRFGHGKAEFLAGLGQAIFISASAFFLLSQGVDRLLHPQPLKAVGLSIGVMVFSILATSVLVLWQKYVISKTQSVAIKADALHYVSDIAGNAGVIVALLFSQLGWGMADPLFAIIISLFIGYNAVQIGSEAINMLLDRELPETVQKEIEAIAMSHTDIKGVHGLRTRQSGHTKVIQMHVELDGDMPLKRAHAVVECVEVALRKAYPGADVIIHQDPYPR